MSSPVGPPPREPTPVERVRAKVMGAALDRAGITGRPFTPRQASRALARYGFKGAAAIDMGLRDLERTRQRETLALSAPNSRSADIHPRDRGLAERVSTMGVLGGGGSFAKAVNLLTSVPRDAAAIGIGLGQFAGRTGYNTTLDVRDIALHPTRAHQLNRLRGEAKQFGAGLASDYKSRYGGDFQEQIAQHPLLYAMDALAGVGAVSRVASVSRGALEASQSGVTPLKAIQQGWWKSRSPIDPRLAVPGRARTLPLGVRDIPLPWSRSPMGRYFQNLADEASLAKPAARLIVKVDPRTGVPIVTRGANIRAGRRAVRLERTMERRSRVSQARAVSAVRHPGGKLRVGTTPADWRLFWEANLPPELRGAGNEGLQMVHAWLTRLRDSPAKMRELEPTANLVAARARYERLRSASEKAVGKNRERIAKQLEKAGADLRGAENTVAQITRRQEEFAAAPVEQSIPKAQARIAEIDKSWDQLVLGVAEAAQGGKLPSYLNLVERGGGKGKRAEARAKLEEKQRGTGKLKTPRQKVLEEAANRLYNAMDKHPEAPGMAELKAMMAERDHLHELISEHQDRIFSGTEPVVVAAPEAPALAHEDIPSNLGRGKYRGAASRYGGAASVAADELQALERRHMNRIGQSREQLQRNLDDVNARLARTGRDTQIRAQLEARVERLQHAIDSADQFTAARGWLRHEQLTRRINELEQAMAHTPDDRYHAALAGAAALTADIDKVAREVLGDSYAAWDAETAQARLAMLPRLMGHDEPRPSDIYAPHAEQAARKIKTRGGITRTQGRRISGEATATDLGLHRRNRGILVESGRIAPDLDHLVVRWGRAQAWKFNQGVRSILWDAGEEIPVGGAPRAGWYIVDKSGKPSPALWQNAELGNDAALAQGLEEFIQSSIRRPNEHPDVIDYGNMRQVDPSIFESVLNESGVEKRSSTLGQSFDFVNGMVRTSLLYANPGYYPANFLGNLIFMGLHQHGFALPNLLRSGTAYFKDRELFDLLSGEVGMGPTEALATARSGAGRLGAALDLEKRATHVAAAIPDVWPRVAAMFHEMRSSGIKTAEEMKALIRSTDAGDVALRQQIADRATEAMVNFDRLSPLEQTTLGRVFFVWPWIRGATAFAGHYMREFPERTGLIAPVATRENRTDRKIMGPVPAYLENLTPLNKLGTHVLNIGSVSPTATAAQFVQTFAGFANSIAHNEPMPKYRSIADMINPLLDFAWYTAHAQNAFGQEMGFDKALLQNVTDLTPLVGTIEQATGHRRVSPVYTDQSPGAVIGRAWARVIPFDVNKKVIAERAAQASPGPAQTPSSRMDEWITETQQLLGGHLPESIRRARRNQMLVEEATIAFKKKVYGTSRHKLDPRETAAVLLSVDASQNVAAWNPDDLRKVQESIRTGPPNLVSDLTRDLRANLYERILRQVNSDRQLEKRRRAQVAYAKSHG